MAPTTSFPKNQIKVLLLENIHPLAVQRFTEEGFQVETLPGALSPAALTEKIRDIHVLGIRSKTQVPAEVLAQAKRLLTVGCFCIGTNQIDHAKARTLGIPVFNAPFGNTRSVAEMVLAEIIMLARGLGQRNIEMHQGIWKKLSTGFVEVRGKTLGIVGYGNIGSQVSTLAEAVGMNVIFYDILPKLPLGNAKPMYRLEDLLNTADIVTLHVPGTQRTENLMNTDSLAEMKKGAHLINASRGTVVDLAALAKALRDGHLAGAALDVFPEEPETNTSDFKTDLRGLSNVVLTPHIAGATEEAQVNIGAEVSATLIRQVNIGATTGAVNFPVVDMPLSPGSHRILNCHKNVPGVLSQINQIIFKLGANISAQALATSPDVGYLVLDTDKALSAEVKSQIESLDASIKTRILF